MRRAIPTQEDYKGLGIKRLEVIVGNLERKEPWDLPSSSPARLKWVRARNALGVLSEEQKREKVLERMGRKAATVSGRVKKGRVRLTPIRIRRRL